MALRRGARRVVTALMLFVLIAAGCSTGGGQASGFSFGEALDLIPASVAADAGGPVTLAMADLDRAAELAGVEPPADASELGAVVDYVNALSLGVVDEDDRAATVMALLPRAAGIEYVRRVDEFEQEVGWSIVDISWFVEYQQLPNPLMVAGGDFDEARLIVAMGEREDGVWRLGSDQDDELDLGDHTAARPLGQPIRVALDDGRLIFGHRTATVEDALAPGDSLAGNDVLRDLAEAMDTQGAYSALFDARLGYPLDPSAALLDSTASPDEFAEKLEDLRDGVLPHPFIGIAGGVADDDGAAVVILAYAHVAAESAEANAEALRTIVAEGRSLRSDEPWSDRFTVDDITVDGSTMTARLTLGARGHPGTAYRLIMEREALTSHR